MALGPFFWFGGKPGEGLPSLGDQVGQHTRRSGDRGRNDRPAIRMLKKKDFKEIHSIPDLIIALFGPSSSSCVCHEIAAVNDVARGIG
jgi:hypothetical protein